MTNAEKKLHFGKAITELVELTSKIREEYLLNKVQNIVKNILKETLDITKTMNYIKINMEMTKNPETKFVWTQVFLIFQKYFKQI